MLGEMPELIGWRGGIGEGRPEPPQALGQAPKYDFGGVDRAAKDAHRPTLRDYTQHSRGSFGEEMRGADSQEGVRMPAWLRGR